MNFYISTSKSFIKYSFICIVLFFILFNTLIYLYANNKTSKYSFVNTKYSKVRHFKMNNPINKDIIFIGSSRTFYNISTKIFEDNNLNTFNLGIAGGKITDYPELISNVIKVHPKKVVISLSINELYNSLEIPKYPMSNDMKFYFTYDINTFLNSIPNYFKHFVPFFEYSETIYLKIKSIYQKFNFINKKEIKNEKSNKYQNDLNNVDCNVFDSKKDNLNHITLKCTNGDGIILGKYDANKEKISNNIKILNINVIRYLNRISNILSYNNIESILIIEPNYNKNFIDNSMLENYKLKFTNILNLSNLSIDKRYFGDEGHFNVYGRDYYSKYLLNRLKNNDK